MKRAPKKKTWRHVHVSETAHRNLRALAEKHGLPMGDIVNQLVEAEVTSTPRIVTTGAS